MIPYNDAPLRALRRVERKCFPKTDRGLGGADESSSFFLHYAGTKLVGYMAVDFDDGDVDVEVLDFAVLPRHRGAGLCLWAAFVKKAKAEGWEVVRAAARRSTTGRLLARYEHRVEWQNEDYVGVVLYLRR